MSGEHTLIFDEPPPLGNDEYPPPVTQLYGSLVACQMSVLAQCLEKARVDSYTLRAETVIDERGLLEADSMNIKEQIRTIDHISIEMELELPEQYESRARRCLDVYDQACTVGQSLRAGIDYTSNTEIKHTESGR